MLPEQGPALEEASTETRSRTFYDTFDWLLFKDGFLLVRDEADGSSELSVIDHATGGVIGSASSKTPPTRPADIHEDRLRELVESAVDLRVLLPFCRLDTELKRWAILNEDGKTTARVQLESHNVSAIGISEPATGTCRLITLSPVRGYDAEFESVSQHLERQFGAPVDSRRFYTSLFELIGREPFDTSSKFVLELDPSERADEAVKQVCRKLLDVIELNENGTRKGIDPEFLHDFRVAIRRTRSVLSQFKKVFPPDKLEHFKEEFRWIGRSTGPLRDMDVYLIRFEDYRSWLSPHVRDNLAPLKRFLKDRQKREHRMVARRLVTKRYRTLLREWRAYLESPAEESPVYTDASEPIGVIARRLTWRAYKKALRQGNAIITDPESPPEAMHRLRITCKKLRYLMELFRSLYPPAEIEDRIAVLKRLQDCLGDYQDFTVQQEHLVLFAREMYESDEMPVDVFLAMGQLGKHLELLAVEVEGSFGDLFEEFSNPKSKQLFAALFKGG